MTHDVVIVGTGPAGVSAAWPLVRAGLRVLLLDASAGAAQAAPSGDFLDLRRRDGRQGDWMIGPDPGTWLGPAASSPKLRVPTLRDVFAGFMEANRIETDNFAAIGSLAAGGLSNAWGCGVARYDAEELRGFPLEPAELDASFAAISRRIGLSGRSDDALADYFGVDAWAESGPPLDRHGDHILRRATAAPARPVRFGRARLALLASDREERKGCDLSGLCLWGCARGALYASGQELPALARAGAELRTGVVVDRLERGADGWRVLGSERAGGGAVAIEAGRVVLAAGTLATTAIAWRTLGLIGRPRPLLSNPTAAFLLLRPAALGRPPVKGPGFGQVAFVADLPDGFGPAYGGLFSAIPIPASEFIRRMPLSRSAARALWRLLAPAAIVGNAFLPSDLNRHTAMLKPDGVLGIVGGQSEALPGVVKALARRWGSAALRFGALVMPGSFSAGLPGSDIHYAGTLPMRRRPAPGETDARGELAGAPGVFVADAATLPALSTKPHTLTMMALADRMATAMARAEAPR